MTVKRLIPHPTRDAADEQVFRVLSAWSPLTADEVAEALGIAPKTAVNRIDRMRARGLLYVARWTQRPGSPIPHVAVGRHPDEPKPRVKTQAEKVREYRKRVQADPKRHKAALRKRRKYWAQRKKEDAEAYLDDRMARESWRRKKVAPRVFVDPLMAALTRPLRHTEDCNG